MIWKDEVEKHNFILFTKSCSRASRFLLSSSSSSVVIIIRIYRKHAEPLRRHLILLYYLFGILGRACAIWLGRRVSRKRQRWVWKHGRCPHIRVYYVFVHSNTRRARIVNVVLQCLQVPVRMKGCFQTVPTWSGSIASGGVAQRKQTAAADLRFSSRESKHVNIKNNIIIIPHVHCTRFAFTYLFLRRSRRCFVRYSRWSVYCDPNSFCHYTF